MNFTQALCFLLIPHTTYTPHISHITHHTITNVLMTPSRMDALQLKLFQNTARGPALPYYSAGATMMYGETAYTPLIQWTASVWNSTSQSVYEQKREEPALYRNVWSRNGSFAVVIVKVDRVYVHNDFVLVHCCY